MNEHKHKINQFHFEEMHEENRSMRIRMIAFETHNKQWNPNECKHPVVIKSINEIEKNEYSKQNGSHY